MISAEIDAARQAKSNHIFINILLLINIYGISGEESLTGKAINDAFMRTLFKPEIKTFNNERILSSSSSAAALQRCVGWGSSSKGVHHEASRP